MKNPFGNNIYKFGAESFLSMFLKQYQIILGADLEEYAKGDQLFNKENPCNIYFVLRRPKITIDTKSFTSNGNKASFDFIVHQREKYNVINLGVELKNATSELKLHSEYPYNLFAISDSTQMLLMARPGSMIDEIEVNDVDANILDYEILYIGQSYGKNGKRTALDRLASHETVQKIYTHALTQNPENDIWIMLANFSSVSALFNLGADLVNEHLKNETRDNKITDNFLNYEGLKFTEKQKINFTEAALIKYFEPKYNIEFKHTFPNKNHKSYSECYNLDIRALTIELDTSEMSRNLYTEKIGRKNHHAEMFEFDTDSDRISLLGIYVDDKH